MTGSALAHTLDQLQARLDPLLRQFGFRKHGRIYNRSTVEDLTQVIGFQMGRSDPPGTIYIPGLRENLYGLLDVNLGVYVPEVARDHGRHEAKSVVHEYNCCIRTRLKRKANKDLWWTISDGGPLVAEISELIQTEALPLFQRFENRDQILDEFQAATHNTELMAVPRIVCAIIVLHRGQREEAQRLLAAQARDRTRNPGHRAYVVELAHRLGIEIEP